jgi:predicted DNA-binding transcriptional regulator YafY
MRGDQMDKKVERIINLYNRLYDGEVLVKSEEAERFGVNERSIQRDIEDIRDYLADDPSEERDLIYDRRRGGYLLVQKAYNRLTNSEILAVCKILLESRAFVKDEMIPIIDKLVQCCVPNENRKKVSALIGNEKFHYIPPHHGKKYVSVMWDLASAVYEHRYIRVTYTKLKNKETVTRLLQPVGIMFSEFYYYLTAYISQS